MKQCKSPIKRIQQAGPISSNTVELNWHFPYLKLIMENQVSNTVGQKFGTTYQMKCAI